MSWTSSLRTVVFALLAAVILLGIVLGQYVPFTERVEPQRAALLVRGGDTMVEIYYLFAGAGARPEEAEIFLVWATDFYLSANDADPSDFRAALSAAILLRCLGKGSTAVSMLPRFRRGQFDQQIRAALQSVYALIISSNPAAVAVERSREYLHGLVPGRLLLASSYREIGQEQRAAAVLKEASARAGPVYRRLVAAIIINGGIILAGLALLGRIMVRRRRPSAGKAAPQAAEQTANLSGQQFASAEHVVSARRWGLREATEALILWVVLGVVFVTAAASGLAVGEEPPVILVLGPSLLAAALAIIWVWAIARFRAGFGWEATGAWRLAATGVSATGLAVLPALAVNGVFRQMMNQSPADDPVIPLLVMPDTFAAKALMIAAAGLAVPVLEETLFRGILFGALRGRWSFWPATLVSAAVFAAAHLHLAGFATYLLLGVFFAYLFERTRSLVTAWAAHAAFNVFNLVVLLTLFG